MVMPSRFEDAEQYVRRYVIDNDGQLPTKKMVQLHTGICADTMSVYSRRFARMGIVLPNTRPTRNITVDALKAFVDEFQTSHERLPLVGEFRKHFDFRGAQLHRFLAMLETEHGIALPEFTPRPIVPKPDPEDEPEEKQVGRATRNERDPRPVEECPHGLRFVVYHRWTRTLRYFADREVISEAASETEAIPFLDRLEREGVYTATA